MDVSKLSIHYSCFYCKKDFFANKLLLKAHWEKGCKRMRECFNTRLIIKPSSSLRYVTVYFNPQNIDIDLPEVVLKHIDWPTTNIHFTTHNRWKKARQEIYMVVSSEGED